MISAMLSIEKGEILEHVEVEEEGQGLDKWGMSQLALNANIEQHIIKY